MGDTDRGDIEIAKHLCKGCCLCVAACPAKVLVQSDFLNRQGYFSISYTGSGCTGCGVCFYVCPEPGAITVFVRKDKEKPSRKPAVVSGCARPSLLKDIQVHDA